MPSIILSGPVEVLNSLGASLSSPWKIFLHPTLGVETLGEVK